MWDQLTQEWRGCLEEAWTAYCMGSLPIGSVIADTHGRILARGRNRIHEPPTRSDWFAGHRLAHAEINALIQIDWNVIDPGSCTLYTTTEPCPLCVGAIRMILLGEVHYAARDITAGSAVLFEATPFLRRGHIKVVGPEHVGLEVILVAMLVEYALGYAILNTTTRYEQLASMDTDGAKLGRRLFASRQLRQWKDERRQVPFVFERLIQDV
jgi:tRNA(adenine34) deaminase